MWFLVDYSSWDLECGMNMMAVVSFQQSFAIY